jgi:diacylglycerol kinase (ATP)
MKPGKKGIERIFDAALYSIKGYKYAWKNEAAFRQEVCLAIILIPVAFYLGETAIEVSILIIPIFITLIIELINSAIEAVVDRIGSELHELSGAAKDIGSAAVLISLVLCGIVWGVFIFEKTFL